MKLINIVKRVFINGWKNVSILLIANCPDIKIMKSATSVIVSWNFTRYKQVGNKSLLLGAKLIQFQTNYCSK